MYKRLVVNTGKFSAAQGASLIFQICENTPRVACLSPAAQLSQEQWDMTVLTGGQWAETWGAPGAGSWDVSPRGGGCSQQECKAPLVLLFQGKELYFYNKSNS